MKVKRIIGLLLVMISLSLLLTSCFDSTPKPNNLVEVKYLPNFNFNNFSPSVVLPDTNLNTFTKYIYYQMTPAMIGFTTNTEPVTVRDGDQFTADFLGATLNIVANVDSVSRIVTFNGSLADGSSIKVTLNAKNNTFNYEQYLIMQQIIPGGDGADPTTFNIITYLKLDNVAIQADGSYHTYGEPLILSSAETLAAKMDYYSGSAIANHELSDGNKVTGFYVVDLRSPVTLPDLSGVDLPTLPKADFLNYFTGNKEWPANTTDSAQPTAFLYYDESLGKFCSNCLYAPTSPYYTTSVPWELLN